MEGALPAAAAERAPRRPWPRVGEDSNDRHARRARRARNAGPSPARVSGAADLATERAAIWRAGASAVCGYQAETSPGASPADRPALEPCGVNFAKRVVRQGLCDPTPHN